MWVLITLILWAAVSVPLALLAGRSLRSSRPRSVAEEAEQYLRDRVPRRARLAWSGAFALAAVLTVGVLVVSNEAVSQLPAAHLAASRGLQRLMGITTTTTVAPPPPTAAAAPPVQQAAARSRRDDGSTVRHRRSAPSGADDLSPAEPTGPRPAPELGAATEDDGPDPGRDDLGGEPDDSWSPSDDDDPADGAERRRRARARERGEEAERRRRAPTTTSSTTTPPSTTTTTTTEPQTETGTTTTTVDDAHDGETDD